MTTEKQRAGLVAIVGRPNAGKSTLMNRLLGVDLSIVTPKAQTTRDQIKGILHEEQGEIIFLDTPGIHRARDGGFNAYMVQQAEQALKEADLIWYLVDPESELEHEELVLERIAKSNAPVFVLLTKSDIVRGQRIDNRDRLAVDLQESLKDRLAICLTISARLDSGETHSAQSASEKATGLAELLEETWKRLPIGPALYPDEEALTDRSTKYFVSEMIREQLFLKMGDEIPYSCAVGIDSFDEQANGTRIAGTIFVERPSQKGMVIGNRGAKIKEIGIASREKLIRFLGGTVHLNLQVALKKNWSKNQQSLEELGYRNS